MTFLRGLLQGLREGPAVFIRPLTPRFWRQAAIATRRGGLRAGFLAAFGED